LWIDSRYRTAMERLRQKTGTLADLTALWVFKIPIQRPNFGVNFSKVHHIATSLIVYNYSEKVTTATLLGWIQELFKFLASEGVNIGFLRLIDGNTRYPGTYAQIDRILEFKGPRVRAAELTQSI
jgi:hypothetical protein